MSLSKNLKKLLFDNDITPTQLAKALSMSISTIHRIVTGLTQKPHKKSVQLISEYFGLGPEELLQDNSNIIVNSKVREIPLIELGYLNDDFINARAIEQIIVSDVSERAFAITMLDNSMELVIEKGSTLIFDPGIKPLDRDYVLVKIAKLNIFTVRQLLIELDHSYIKSLNNNSGVKNVRPLASNDLIVARLVEIRRKI